MPDIIIETQKSMIIINKWRCFSNSKHMKKLKQILLSFPEYYLVVLVVLSGYTPPISINPIFIVLALIIVIQIIFKNKGVGLIMGGLVILISLFMIFPLLSKFSEFTTFNASAAQLLFVGLALIIFNMFAGGLMIYKFQLKDDKPTLLPG